MNTLLLLIAFIQCATQAIEVQNNNDTVFIFSDEIGLKTADDSPTDWFAAHDTTSAIATGTSEIYPGPGQGIAVKHNGVWERCFVVQLDTLSYQMTVTPECTNTLVTLSKPVPALTYTDRNGQTQALPRTLTFQYNNLVWKEEDGWESTLFSKELPADGATYSLPPIYDQTDILLLLDSAWREDLGMAPDSAVGDITAPVAFTIHATHTATTRWEGAEKVNENEAPSNPDCLSGSGALDIFFQSNPTPAAEWFSWEIYKSTDLLFSRRDQDQRYLFEDLGNYTVKVSVTNTLCSEYAKDTAFDVTISKSFIRVPNVFTPNGDGVNDEFRVEYESLVEYHIWVYNRWDKLVYESTNPMVGWDGKINGSYASPGAYFYVIRAKGVEAAQSGFDYMSKVAYNRKNKKGNSDESPNMNGIYQLSGDINLIR